MKKALTNRKILVIDDDLSLLHLIKDVLERAGYHVFCADNGADGILLNAQEHPDLIILDLQMPDLDGIATLRTIRHDDSQARVIILTGYGTPDTIRDAADLNASEYLTKPFKNKDLISVISKALAP
jgi:DNA-binding response OmpR family regulator